MTAAQLIERVAREHPELGWEDIAVKVRTLHRIVVSWQDVRTIVLYRRRSA